MLFSPVPGPIEGLVALYGLAVATGVLADTSCGGGEALSRDFV
jgi:hypothetical protein